MKRSSLMQDFLSDNSSKKQKKSKLKIIKTQNKVRKSFIMLNKNCSLSVKRQEKIRIVPKGSLSYLWSKNIFN